MGNCISADTLVHEIGPLCGDDTDLLCDYSGPGPWSTCDPQLAIAQRMAKRGCAGPECQPTTLMSILAEAARLKGDKPALLVERPLPPLGKDGRVAPAFPREKWATWTFKDYQTDVRRAAKAFIALGMSPFESVNLWGFNSPEWCIAAMAAVHVGGKCAGFYPTDSADIAAYKVVHSCGAVVVMEDHARMQPLVKELAERGDCTRLRAFVVYGSEPTAGETVLVKGCGAVPVLSWRTLLELGDERGSDAQVDTRIAAIQPGHCAALIYTSGTTGMPKGVMISHDNLVATAYAGLSMAPETNFCTTSEEERQLSYLPLSHIGAFCLDMMTQLVAAAMKPAYIALFFARPYDIKAKSLKDRLLVVQPTMFWGVPLVWERIADQLRAIGAEITGLKRSIADWAKGLALEHARNCQLGGSREVPMGLSVANALILSKIREKLGLSQCKTGLSGAAPIRPSTLEYFASLGLPIFECFGMSESTVGVTASSPRAQIWGSCGFAVPGTDVKIFLVDPTDVNKKVECPRAPDLECTDEKYQGELCYRGRCVMMGYMASPDFGAQHAEDIARMNAQAIDAQGWMHSGDKAMMSVQGMVKITGRYKELIIGDGGENIAPVPIEHEVRKGCDGICEVMMVGDKRKYCVALITLKAVGANGEVPGTDQLDALAKRVNPAVQTISAAMSDKVWIETITNAIKVANANGKICPNAAFHIQKFSILPTNFSEEAGELTPTKKLKRKYVEERYSELIEKLYTTQGMYVPYSA